MRRILFVDDEPKILEGLQRMLRPQRQQWQMSFATSGEAALELLEAKPFDAIVSDMRMPGMDGAALLTEVRDRFPGVVRLVLSGYTSLATALRAVPVAHQFMTKPCEPNVLQVTVERACSLKEMIGSDLVARTVGGLHELPPLPRTYGALLQALSDPGVELKNIARIVEQDVAASARVLRLVNSPLFGVSRSISTIRTALGLLGIDTLKNLVLSAETYRAFDGAQPIGGYTLERIHAHSYLTACIAARLPTEKTFQDTGHLASMLHDVGKLVLMRRLPGQFAEVVRVALAEGREMLEVEKEVLGVTHCEIGAYLLGLWGLPFPVIEAAAYHHNPSQVPHQTFDCLATVHVADVLAHASETRTEGAAFVAPHFDQAFLEHLGVADQIAVWQSMAAEVANASNGS